jgi:hypothetical protein
MAQYHVLASEGALEVEKCIKTPKILRRIQQYEKDTMWAQKKTRTLTQAKNAGV